MSDVTDLALSILAMDAYDQGDESAVTGVGGSLGFATVLRLESLGIDQPQQAKWVAAGFSATAYTLTEAVGDLPVGTVVISYRGTDSLLGKNGSLWDGKLPTDGDILNGYGLGAGLPTASQGALAIEFYNTVRAQYGAGNVVLTGHSLGGGLAGYVGALVGAKATLFDNMPFEAAARNIQAIASAIYDDSPVTVDSGTGMVINAREYYSSYIPYCSLIYGNSKPSAADISGLKTIYTAGEFLAALRQFQSTPQSPTSIGSGVDLPGIDSGIAGGGLHSMALLAIALYGKANISDWNMAAEFFMPALYSDEIAKLLGAESRIGRDRNGVPITPAADVMRDAIAYSVAGAGTASQEPFGDTSVRALFDDASDLGRVLSVTRASTTVKRAAQALSDAFVQFSGQLALGKVLDQQSPEAKNGILAYDADQKRLTAKFDASRWSIGSSIGQLPATILGRTELTDAVLSGFDAHSSKPSVTRPGMQWLWNDTDSAIIDEVAFVTTDENRTTSLTAREVPNGKVRLYAGSGANDTITGSSDDEIIYGGDGTNELWGGGGNDLLVGGNGNDTFHYDGGRVFAFGGAGGQDKVLFQTGVDAKAFVGTLSRDASSGNAAPIHDFVETVEGQPTGNELRVSAVGNVVLTDKNDTLSVIGIPSTSTSDLAAGFMGLLVVDGGGGTGDILDLSKVKSGDTQEKTDIYFESNILKRSTSGSSIAGPYFRGFEYLQGSSGVDHVVGARGFTKISLGDGNDIITNTKTAAVIDGGAGDDQFDNIATGSVVTLGSGKDKVNISSKQVLIADASAEDKLFAFGGLKLTGGTRLSSSEDIYAYDGSRLVKFGYDKAGELVVTDRLGNQVFIANGASTAYGSDAATRAFGLYVFEMSWTSRLLRELKTGWNVYESYATVLGHYAKAMTGFSGWKGVDPLVLDLDGDGVTLTGQSSVSPRFDTDGDGFAEKTGWVGSHDGLLALDRNGNGVIDDVSELFGGPRAGGGTDLDGDGTISFSERMQSGFEALAAYDDNADGKIDASDAIFSQLRVWIDANGDAITDAGELKTLDEVGIASISLGSTAQASTFVSGNQVTDVGHFTRTDGTTSEVDNVALKLDNFDSVWLGQATVTAAAAALPELRGHGTLADLRQVLMVEDRRSDGLAPLHAALAASTPSLVAARGLDALRDAAAPVLQAWAAALPTTQVAGTYSNVHVVLGTGDKSRTVVDYAYARKDAAGVEHWVLASRGDPTQADDPTSFDALMTAHSELDGRWRTLDAADFSFIERYIGENLPSHLDAGDAWSAMVATFDTALTYIDMLSVRLAVQVAPEFYGLSYDRDQDIFHPATVRQLVPFFESIFGEVKTADTAAIEDRFSVMKPVFDRIISAYDRETGSSINSYGFVYSNIVAAWENVGLPVSLKAAAIDFGIPASMIVEGGAGAVDGTSGDDLFYLGAGDQTMTGGNGHDNYIVGKGFGHDTIVDVEPFGTSQNEDYLRFAQAASTDIRADRDGLDLVLTQISTGDTVRVVNEFIGVLPGVFGVGNTNDDCGVTLIQFADGVTWTKEDIAWKVSHAAATSDLVLGSPDMDVLDGGAGDDTLVGGNDFDIYVFDRGYGHDVIDERVSDANFALNNRDQDAVKFGAGIGMDDVAFHRAGNSSDLLLTFSGSDDTLTIHNEFGSAYTGVFGEIWEDRIEILQFVEDGQIGWDEILTRTIASQETDGNDAVFGFSAADVLDGGAGDDTLSGGNDTDTYVFGYGYGHDIINDDMTNILAADGDRLSFAPGIVLGDVAFSHPEFGNDLVATLSDGSSVTIHGEFDVTYTGVFGDQAFNRIEYFDFTSDDGTITEYGYEDIERLLLTKASTSGDDRIFGFDGADTLDGGAGDDFLFGGSGGDTYVFGHGYGHDRIQDESTNLFAPDGDVLIMKSDVTPDQVKVTRSGQFDLVLTLADTGESVTLVGQVDNNTLGWWPTQIETVSFSDGTTWTPADLRRIALAQATTSGDDTIVGFKSSEAISGGAGNDTLRGGEGDDTLIGGVGDDLLVGDDGNDTYLWARGDGNDVVTDDWWVGLDQVRLEGVTSDMVTLQRSGNTIRAVISESAPGAGDGGSVSFAGNPSFYGRDEVDQLVFDDGTVWTIADMRQKVLDLAATGGNDEIVGFGSTDRIAGGAGNDTLSGMGGNDTLIGGAGDDLIYGGEGDDTYLWARGDGNDVIADGLYDGTDRIVLQDVSVDSVSARFIGGKIAFTIGESAPGAADGGSLTFVAGGGGHDGIERVEFSDGTVWSPTEMRAAAAAGSATSGDDSITGSSEDDVLSGGRGNDTLAGGDGNDTYLWARGDGNDVIFEGLYGGTDRIVLQGVTIDAVSARSVDGRLELSIAESAPGAGDGGLITFTAGDGGHDGIEQLVFADGTILGHDGIVALAGPKPIWGTSGNDEIWGTNESELIEGLAGNDSLFGQRGNDTLSGGTGDDTLSGGNDDDTYLWARGDGNDLLVDDVNQGQSDLLILQGVSTSDVHVRHASDRLVTLEIAESSTGAGDGGSLTFGAGLDDWSGNGIDRIQFADGTIWTQTDVCTRVIAESKTSGDDEIRGFRIADTLSGGAGDDTLYGGDGNDTYLWARGDGNDLLVDDVNQGRDLLILQGVVTSDVHVRRASDRLVTLEIAESSTGAGDGGSLTFGAGLDDWSGNGIDRIQFADGTIWTQTDVCARVLAGLKTAGNDEIRGFPIADTLSGGAGDDTLYGGDGNDTYLWARGDGNDLLVDDVNQGRDLLILQGVVTSDVHVRRASDRLVTLEIAESSTGAGDGGSLTFGAGLDDWSGNGIDRIQFADGTIWTQTDVCARVLAELKTPGNDEIRGFPIADTLSGGAGDDTLYGGDGNDTYVWARGDGNDTIVEDWFSGNADKLILSGVDPGEVTLVRNGTNVTVVVAENSGIAGGSILLMRELDSENYRGVEKVIFDNGTTWSTSDILARAVSFTAMTAGDDTYAWTQGSGSEVIGGGEIGGIDRLTITGVDLAHLDLARGGANNADLLVTDTVSGETITVQGQFYGAGTGIESLVVGGVALDTTAIAEQAWYRGGSGNDGFWGGDLSERFDGKGGDDTLVGGAGSDTYLYRRGDGNDSISDYGAASDVDRLVFADLERADVGFARAASDLWSAEIRVTSTGETIHIDHQFNGAEYGLEQIVFADGSTMSASDIAQASVFEGSTGTDYFYGTDLGETFDGKGGADVLVGGGGSDTYLYRAGDGNDAISDYGAASDTDRLVFSGLDRSDVTFSRVADDVWSAEIHVTSTGETIHIDHQFTGPEYGIEAFDFADGSLSAADVTLAAAFKGTSGTDYLYGTAASETFVGRLGADVLVGGAGDDVYRYASGDGNDVIDDTDGTADRLVFSDLTASDVRLLIVGDDLQVDVIGTGETITDTGHFTSATRGLDQIAFSDGTTWSRADIASHAAAA